MDEELELREIRQEAVEPEPQLRLDDVARRAEGELRRNEVLVQKSQSVNLIMLFYPQLQIANTYFG